MPRYTVLLTPEPEAGGYSVTVPALPGCITQGDTLEEALTNAREAIGLHLWGMLQDGEALPEDIVPRVVAVDAVPLEGRPLTAEELAAIENEPAWDGRMWA